MISFRLGGLARCFVSPGEGHVVDTNALRIIEVARLLLLDNRYRYCYNQLKSNSMTYSKVIRIIVLKVQISNPVRSNLSGGFNLCQYQIDHFAMSAPFERRARWLLVHAASLHAIP